jgi:hypothetical protein
MHDGNIGRYGRFIRKIFFGNARFIMLGENIVARRLCGRCERIAFKYIFSAQN